MSAILVCQVRTKEDPPSYSSLSSKDLQPPAPLPPRARGLTPLPPHRTPPKQHKKRSSIATRLFQLQVPWYSSMAILDTYGTHAPAEAHPTMNHAARACTRPLI